MNPQQIGPWAIGKVVGRGGMGVVLLGRAPDGREAAIKLLTAWTPAAAERFQREVRLQGQLGEAEGFVPLIDAGMSPQGPYLAMPFLPGGNLRDRLRKGPMDVDAALDVMIPVSRAMGLAHARGLIHRDLKPDNVLFTADGRPLIADLGLAKHFDREAGGVQSVSLSKTGEMRGTAGYMPREQIGDAKNVRPATDVFSLAAILYELVAGVGPFQAETFHGKIAQVIAGDFTPLRKARKDCPAWLAPVVERALAREPDDRFVNGEAFASALEAARPTPTRPDTDSASGADGAAAPSKLPFVLVGVGALALVAALAASRGLGGEGPGAPATTPAGEPPPVASTTPVTPVTPVTPAAPATVWPEYLASAARSDRTRLVHVLGEYAGMHREVALALALRPNGDVVVGGRDQRVTVWTQDGQLRARLGPTAGAVTALALSPDGRLAATGSQSGVVERWDLEQGTYLGPTVGAKADAMIQGLAWSPDGVSLASGSADGWVRLADGSTGAGRKKLQVGSVVSGLAFLVGQDRLLATSDGRLVTVELANEPRLAGALQESGLAPLGLALSDNCKRAITLAADANVIVWDLQPPSPPRLIPMPAPPMSVAINKNGRRAAVGLVDGRALLLDLEEQRVMAEVPAQIERTGVVAFSQDGQRLATTGGERRVRLWDLRPEPGPDGRTSISADARWPLGPLFFVGSLAVLDGGARLLSAGGHGIVSWSLTTGAWLPAPGFEGHHPQRNVNGIVLSRDGRRILSVGHDQTGCLWTTDGALVARLRGVHPNNVLSGALSKDGQRALTAGDDRKLALWSLAQPDAPLRAHDLAVKGDGWWSQGVAFTPDERAAVNILEDGTLAAWDLETGAARWQLQAHAGGGTCRMFAMPDASRLLTCAHDGKLLLWELGACEVAPTAPARTITLPGKAWSVVGFPDGRHAAVGIDPGVLIYDLQTGAIVARMDLSGPDDVPHALAVTPDGGRLIVGGLLGVTLVFDVDLD